MIKRPLITEKATRCKEENVYVFEVDKNATKADIKKAVEELFKVKVERVRTANFLGKYRRQGRYGGYKSDWKKAYVVLSEGQSIKIGE